MIEEIAKITKTTAIPNNVKEEKISLIQIQLSRFP